MNVYRAVWAIPELGVQAGDTLVDCPKAGTRIVRRLGATARAVLRREAGNALLLVPVPDPAPPHAHYHLTLMR